MGVPQRTRPTSPPRDTDTLPATGGRSTSPSQRDWRTYGAGRDPRGRPAQRAGHRSHVGTRQPERPRPSGRRAGTAAKPPARNAAATWVRPGPLRLTGRGGIIVLFVITCLGLLFSDAVGVRVLAEITFVATCVLAAWYVKARDVLTITIAPPLVFFVAAVLANILTSSGFTATAAGILLTLTDAAPWLFAGTVLVIVIGLRRGLVGAVRELRGVPPAPRRRAGGHRGRR